MNGESSRREAQRGFRGKGMERFEYEITTHRSDAFYELIFFCSNEGSCDLNKVPGNQTRIFSDILNVRGSEGWELIQVSFGKDGCMAFWKRRIRTEEIQ